MSSLESLTDAEIDKITHLNAMRHFSYDPFAHIAREQATVASLRARAAGWDVSEVATRHLRPGGAGPSPSGVDRFFQSVAPQGT